MRATMNLLSTLVFIAIGLFLPALSVPAAAASARYRQDRSLFVLETKAYGDPPTKLICVMYNEKNPGGFSFYPVQPDKLDEFEKKHDKQSSSPISFAKLPKDMLLIITAEHRELYSEALPYLLKELPLENVAKELPKDLLKNLKPEDKKNISAEVLAKFEKLYN